MPIERVSTSVVPGESCVWSACPLGEMTGLIAPARPTVWAGPFGDHSL